MAPILYRGHSVFEYNTHTGEVQMLEVVFQKGPGNREAASLEIREGCKYFQALNLQNAIRKIEKSGYRVTDPGIIKDLGAIPESEMNTDTTLKIIDNGKENNN